MFPDNNNYMSLKIIRSHSHVLKVLIAQNNDFLITKYMDQFYHVIE